MDFSKLEARLASMIANQSISRSVSSNLTGRQLGKSVAHAMNYGGFRSGGVVPTAPVYTAEQHQAFAAAIEGLCEQYPVYGWNRGARKRSKVRLAAIKLAREGHKDMAFSRAVYGNIPKDALRAVEILIFN